MTTPTIRPTIGRTLWFYASPEATEYEIASIAAVRDDGHVDVEISGLGSGGQVHANVPLVQPGEDGPASGPHVEWSAHDLSPHLETEPRRRGGA